MENKFSKELASFKKLEFSNQYNFKKEEIDILPYRFSVRSVILLDNNKIVIIKVSSENYHSITGGEVNEGEDLIEAVVRESLEESGYDVSIMEKVGYIEYCKPKYRKIDFCFLVKSKGEQKPLSLTPTEIAIGHSVEEYTIDEAISILEKDVKIMKNPVSERSLIFLREVKNIHKFN